MYSPSRDKGCLVFLGYHGLHGSTLSPANAALFLTLVNDQNIPVMLSDYLVEMKTGDGSWAPLVRLSAIGMTVFVGADVHKLSRVSDNSVFLDNIIAGKTIQPHDVVMGWSLFEYPREYGPTFLPEFRITLRDYQGTKYLSPVMGYSHENPGGGTEFPHFSLNGQFDLSGWYMRYWTDPVQ
jgi:hypothetical protein